MTRDAACCGNAECARCETPSTERAVLLAKIRVTNNIDDLVTMALAGDEGVRVEAVRALARWARLNA